MNYLGRGVKDLYQGVKDFYSEINPATLTGAIDVIVVQQEDGSFKSSPFHVRFGKMALIKTKDLTVDIEINGKPVDLHMKLSEAGDAYFVDESFETTTDVPLSPSPSQSPSSSSKSPDLSNLSNSNDSLNNEEKSKSTTDLNHHISISSETLSNQNQDQEEVAVVEEEEEKNKKPPVVKSVPIAINPIETTMPKAAKLTKCLSTVETSLASPVTPKPHLASSIPSSRGMMFFSDGEITPEPTSPVVSRPTSPRSDYEIGIQVRLKRDYENNLSSSPEPSSPTLVNGKKLKKPTRLSSSQIAQLNLHPGANEVIYSVTTALQGTTRITSYIFLWNYDEKVIVSDIDGTITKSDVWGQVLPIFGRDWTQAGVADLYSAIEKNQYKFIYLSARAIGQSRITRDLLKNVNQGGLTLPKGPLLVTPTSLLTAFQKEVIEKKPEEFKISCLQDVSFLFPPTHNPFHAGYGNKTSDTTAYKAVGIPVSRIFTINPQGELKHEVSRTFRSSYSNLCDFVDLIFPPLKPSAAIVKPEYDSFNFWRPSSYMSDELIAEIEHELKKI